jgi:ESCRT-II complex subunit VPS36
MTEARDLVLVINKYVATLENKKKLEGSNNGQVVVINEEEERLSEMLSHMGMMSAITKKSSGSLYHQQLARQLADFLIQSNIIIKQGGMITLADVYCLFNRARGTNLITPGTYDIFALCVLYFSSHFCLFVRFLKGFSLAILFFYYYFLYTPKKVIC